MVIMAHGVSEVVSEGTSVVKMVPGNKATQQVPNRQQGQHHRSAMGSRRIFPPAFKVKVLDSYRNDEDCKLNQRATARKFNIHRRQIQKWLQNEKTLRDSCPDGASGSLSATPAASPPQEQKQPTPASPALNLSLARLHGDELAAAAAQQQQQHQPPPPQSTTAQALAPHQQQQPDYQFRVSPTAAITLPATGYPDFKDGHPIRQPAPHQYTPNQIHGSSTNYPMLDLYHRQPIVYQAHRDNQTSPPITHHGYESTLDHLHQPRFSHSHFPTAPYESKIECSSSLSSSSSPSSSSSSPPSSSLSSPHHSEDEPQRRASMIPSADIKTERASPDSLATPIPATSPLFTKVTQVPVPFISQSYPPQGTLKREHPDEEEQYDDTMVHPFTVYHRPSSLSNSCSPAPSHQDPMESLPLSPDRSSASSDSEMEQHPSGGTDLARRRSFSLRFKLEVLNAFHRDKNVAGNQRATARKFNINRRQVQKWLGQENELRGVIGMCGSDNRQRLGPIHETDDAAAVDLRMSFTTLADLGQTSPHSNLVPPYGCDYFNATSPGNYINSASLTPPYSTPGCSLSCCQDTPQPYYSYSLSDLDSPKRSICMQSCCLPPTKKLCTEDTKVIKNMEEPEQDSPLCLVKPKHDTPSQSIEHVSSTIPSPSMAPVQPPSKKDAILFKPYLDNPVSKPCSDESTNNNNNCQNVCNLNEKSGRDLELEMSFKPPVNNYRAQQLQQQQPPQTLHHTAYLDIPPVKSAFVRYPSSVHYS